MRRGIPLRGERHGSRPRESAGEHGEWLTDLGVTLAVIDSQNRPAELTPEQYWRDVIHHHAHRYPHQEPASWWKYRLRTRRRIK